MAEKAWYVYIIRSDRDQLYTGISIDPVRRYQEHASGTGARFFRVAKPVEMVFCLAVGDRAAASSMEMKIKRMTRRRKLALIANSDPVPDDIRVALSAL